MDYLLVPMFGHVLWCTCLYLLLTLARAPVVWHISTPLLCKLAGRQEQISANLRNQFEWPVLFYAANLLAVVTEQFIPHFISMAWLFVAGRITHSLVQICTDNIRLRGLVFTMNFVAVLLMWCLLVAQQ